MKNEKRTPKSAEKPRRPRGNGRLFQKGGSGNWIARWTGIVDGKRKRIDRSTGTATKAKAERILRGWLEQEALRQAGLIDPRAERLAKHARTDIDRHIADWIAAAAGRNTTPRHRATIERRARRVLIDECGFESLEAIDPARVQGWMADRHRAGDAARTVNSHLANTKQFLTWCVQAGRLSVNPLASVRPVRMVEASFERRSLSVDELHRLVTRTESAATWRTLSGPDRAMLYRVTAGTGFRAAEVATLTPGCFELDGDEPAISIGARLTKNRKPVHQPIRHDLADLLRPWLKGKRSGEPVWPVRDISRLARVLRADMERARHAWVLDTTDPAVWLERLRSDFLAGVDARGHRVDFHALRASFITMVVQSGASVSEAMELARHSDPRLTLKNYTRLKAHDLRGALDRVPTPQADQPTERDALRATGTDRVVRLRRS